MASFSLPILNHQSINRVFFSKYRILNQQYSEFVAFLSKYLRNKMFIIHQLIGDFTCLIRLNDFALYKNI